MSSFDHGHYRPHENLRSHCIYNDHQPTSPMSDKPFGFGLKASLGCIANYASQSLAGLEHGGVQTEAGGDLSMRFVDSGGLMRRERLICHEVDA